MNGFTYVIVFVWNTRATEKEYQQNVAIWVVRRRDERGSTTKIASDCRDIEFNSAKPQSYANIMKQQLFRLLTALVLFGLVQTIVVSIWIEALTLLIYTKILEISTRNVLSLSQQHGKISCIIYTQHENWIRNCNYSRSFVSFRVIF